MRAGVRPRVNCGAVRGGANDRWYPNLLDRAMTSMLKRHYKAGAVESLAAEPRSLPALMRKSAPRWVAAAVPSIYGSIKVDNLEPS